MSVGCPVPWELSYGRWQVYCCGPEAVNSSRLDSFRPSPVQMLPWAAQSWPPATGLPECLMCTPAGALAGLRTR